jgi:hypothetical protein
VLGLAGVCVLEGGHGISMDGGKLFGVLFALGAAVFFALGIGDGDCGEIFDQMIEGLPGGARHSSSADKKRAILVHHTLVDQDQHLWLLLQPLLPY